MKQFTYLIQKDFAIHFGPAGRLSMVVKQYPDTSATIQMGERIADLSRPIKVATMGLRKGDAVTVSVSGPSEAEMFDVLCQYFDAAM